MLRLLAPRVDEICMFGTGASLGPVGLYAGVAYRSLGDTTAAEAALRTAVGTAERGLGGPWGALARRELARLLDGDVAVPS